MKIEALCCSFLRLIVGAFMLIHATFNVVTYGIFTLTIERYLINAKMLDNSVLSIAAPLFPFIEFLLGALLIFGLFYKKTLLWTMLFFAGTTVFLFLAKQNPTGGIAIVLTVISFYMYWKSEHCRKRFSPKRGLHTNITFL